MSRAALWTELFVAYALIQAALWTPRPQQDWLIAAGYVWVIGVVAWRGRRLGPLGFQPPSLRMGTAIVGGAAALALLILGAGKLAGTLHPLFRADAPWWYGIGYWVWAAVQQFVLQTFFYRWLEFLLGSRLRAAAGAAALFGLAHIPNPVLLPATAAGGFILCLLFARQRSLWPLALAHAAVGLALAMAIPVDVHRKMRVGRAYVEYRPASLRSHTAHQQLAIGLNLQPLSS